MKFRYVLFVFCFCGVLCASCLEASKLKKNYVDLFDEICELVEQNFYDPNLLQERFLSIKVEYRRMVKLVSSSESFSLIINSLLNRLNTSHTYYLTPADFEYYHLAGIFHSLPHIKKLFDNEEIRYPSVGLITLKSDGRDFIASVLPGSAAERAGLLAGDEIVAVNGTRFMGVTSIRCCIGEKVRFSIRRKASDHDLLNFDLVPVLVNPKAEMLEAEKASMQIIQAGTKKIGYVHLFSYAGSEYHEELLSALSFGSLKDIDALIIDLRYGLGGADPAYLNMFNKKVPVLMSFDNKGQKFPYDKQFRKPAVYLTNRYSRSGKELLAYGAKKFKLATVIGENTAGSVTAGRLFSLTNGDLLYLAVMGAKVDGEVLEGCGVAPDILIKMDVRYSQGQDIQLQGAIDHLIKILG